MISFDGKFSEADLQPTFYGLGEDIFFLQIGAMDGVTHDPIHKSVLDLNWRGILVEPIPYLNQKLQENYKSATGLIFSDMAIADFDGKIEMAFIDPAKAASGVFEPGGFGTSTIMRDRGLLSGKNMPPEAMQIFQQHTSIIEVPCCRLDTLLDKHGVTKIDLLVIDVEGADWMVARQLSLKQYAPRIVYLEYAHLTDYEKTACAYHFQNHGYRIFIDDCRAENFLAIRAN